MAEYEKRVRDILSEHGCSFRRRWKGDHDSLLLFLKLGSLLQIVGLFLKLKL